MKERGFNEMVSTYAEKPHLNSFKENWQPSKINLPWDTNPGIWQDGSSFNLFHNYPKYVSTLNIFAFSLCCSFF